jgi:uncharacterized repeat protein (TIGR01451 family)
MKLKIFHLAQIGLRPLRGPSLIAVAALLFSAVPASAAIPSAGWSISAVSEPTHFSIDETQDTVEELTIAATGGTYEVSPSHIGTPTAPIAWNASAKEVQQALETLPEVGGGAVEVTGAAGGPYKVTWIGRWSGRSPGNLLTSQNNLTDGVSQGSIVAETITEGKASDRYTVTVVNVGSRPSEGQVTITDRLPAGLVAVEATVEERASENGAECSVAATITCSYGEAVAPGGELLITIRVAVLFSSASSALVNEAAVSGGGAAEVVTTESTAVNVGPATFGIVRFAVEANGVDGTADLQAGDHPYSLTTTLSLNDVFDVFGGTDSRLYNVPQDVKQVIVELPLGVVGDPLAAERCPETDLTDPEGGQGHGRYHTSCPIGSRVGRVRLVLEGGARSEAFPLYNVVPEHGYPAELGFNAGLDQPIFMYASVVPSAAGYRLRVAEPAALRAGETGIEGISLTVWGNPAEHDGGPGADAFLTNPMGCTASPSNASVEVAGWEGGLAKAESTAYPDVTGCDLLQGAAAFDPSIKVKPTTTQADTPAGYEVDVKLPQAPNVFGALATPELKNATVTLPSGVSISPSAASGPNALEGCRPAQIDLLGTELGEGHPGGNGSPYDDGLTHASAGHCPESSRIGEVELKTPLLEEELHGHVYLAQPKCGGPGQAPCTEAEAEEGKVFGLYLEVSGSGVIIKLAGSVEAGGYGTHSADTGLARGQLRARFNENPQMPFEELKLTFTGGQRAPLENPQSCGTATTSSDLEPWSAPESGPNATPAWPFTVTGCAGPMGFSPSFSAGTVQTLADGFSPFTMTLTRKDGEQNLGGVSLTMPPGVAGMISKVPLCGEPQAREGTCPAVSRIGTTTVAAGSGSQPLWLNGTVYITGPYHGAPFGLSIVVPAQAGPFNLGNEVVRATINVDPHTSALTITSEPLPQIKDGVPFRLKTVNVTIDRPEFMFNPTNCAQQAITGTIAGVLPDGSPGTSVPVSTPFAVAGCKNLPFKPKFTALTQAKTSKAGGAYLHVKVVSGAGQANIGKVKVDLPKQLPSRLTTLQKACTAAVFEASPASCPAASVVGTGTAVTPVLKSVLTGPAYLVSHGGAAFPDLVIVLQGEGITLYLVGNTDIKKGITSSTFKSVPDAPITTFDLVLPEGPHSVLAANGNLCKTTKTVTVTMRVSRRVHGRVVHVLKKVKKSVAEPLVMPTRITGQNGAVLQQTTKVAVTGCSKPKAKKKAKPKKKGKGKKGKGR